MTQTQNLGGLDFKPRRPHFLMLAANLVRLMDENPVAKDSHAIFG